MSHQKQFRGFQAKEPSFCIKCCKSSDILTDTRHIKCFPEHSKLSSLMKREMGLFSEGGNQKVSQNFSPAN